MQIQSNITLRKDVSMILDRQAERSGLKPVEYLEKMIIEKEKQDKKNTK